MPRSFQWALFRVSGLSLSPLSAWYVYPFVLKHLVSFTQGDGVLPISPPLTSDVRLCADRRISMPASIWQKRSWWYNNGCRVDAMIQHWAGRCYVFREGTMGMQVTPDHSKPDTTIPRPAGRQRAKAFHTPPNMAFTPLRRGPPELQRSWKWSMCCSKRLLLRGYNRPFLGHALDKLGTST